MTRDQAKKFAKEIVAFANGENIQMAIKYDKEGNPIEWVDCGEDLFFVASDYRISFQHNRIYILP